jgi:phenylpropionate dioxygenase-like ring-hydroxylating dioxygenase large terminal subunit
MDATLEAEIIERGIRERERDAYPDGFPVLPPVPAGRYVDAGFAALEEEYVFGASWLFVAHVDELAAPGDFITLRQFPQPIFLVRGGDGVVRAFYNTCQHRGAPLVAGAGNTGRRLVCPYHSWAYDLDGSLVGIPSPCDWADPAKECLSLRAIRCETWGAFVFINLSDAGPSLRESLGAVGRELDDQIGDGPDVGRVHLLDRRSIEVAGNWKLTVDANIETYHVNTVHRNSAALLLDQRATGIWLLPNGHSRMLVHNKDEQPFPVSLPGFPAASKLAGYGIYSYHLFPNTSVVFGGTPAILFCISSWPLGPERSFYDVHFMAPVPMDGEHHDILAMLVEANWMVLQEDLGNLASMQQSMSCRSLRSIPLSYQERRIYHQHEEIDRRIGARVPEELRVAPMLGGFVE